MAVALLVLSYCFLGSTAGLAQTPTAVTGQITDPNGLAYSNASITAQLVGIPPTQTATIVVNGIPVQIGGLQRASLDVNGNLTMNLFCNTAGGGCSVISPSGTQWQFTVSTTGVLPPVGTGPQQCSATVTITGASQTITSSFSCPILTHIPGSSSGTPVIGNVVNATAYGVVAHVKKTCNATWSNASQTITTGSNEPAFLPTDVGDIMFGTNGPCQGAEGANGGAVVVPQGTITAWNNAHSVTVSTTTTAACTGGTAGCEFAWGPNDDTTSLQNAFNAATVGLGAQCAALQLPGGNMFVSAAIVNTTATCGTLNAGDPLNGYAVFGQGMDITHLIILPSFNANTCVVTTFGGLKACLFGFSNMQYSMSYHDFTINGLGNSAVTNGSGAAALFSSAGGLTQNVGITDWGNNTPGFTGFVLGNGSGGSFVYAENVQVWNGGYVPCNFTGYNLVSGVVCVSYSTTNIQGLSNNTFSSLFFNDLSNTILISTVNTSWSDYGSQVTQNGSGQSAITCASGATSIYLNGTNIYSVYNGINIYSGTCSWHVQNTTISASNAAITGTSGQFFDQGGNSYTGTISIVPSCAFTSGGGTSPSCVVQAGSTNEKGVIIATTGTGSPGSTGTITLTFFGTSYTGATGTTASCTYNVDNSGTAWGNEAGVQINTESTTAPVLAWYNLASGTLTALTASSPYRIGYHCTAR